MSIKFFDNDWTGEPDKKKPKSNFVDTYGPGKYVKCSDTHPPLKIGQYTVYGGACAKPLKEHGHYDIEIGLDYNGSNKFPWDNVIAIHFPINDREAPKEKDIPKFKKMIVWTAEQIKAGKKVHVGCMGGHGRTSLVLVALVVMLDPDVEDPIAYVREHYCPKAVETNAQVKFLMKHYHVKEAKAAKSTFLLGDPPAPTTTTVYDPTTRGTPTEMEAWLKRFPQPGMNTYESWKADEEKSKSMKRLMKIGGAMSNDPPIEVRPVMHKATVLGCDADMLKLMDDPTAPWNQ